MTHKPQWEIDYKEQFGLCDKPFGQCACIEEIDFIRSQIEKSYQQGVEDMRRKCVDNIQEFLLSEMRGNNRTEMQEFEIACDDIIKLIKSVDNPVDSPTQPDTMSR